MTTKLGFILSTFWVFCLTVVPSYADERPRAHLEGFRCKVLSTDQATSDPAVPTVVECQIGDDSEPFAMVFLRPIAPIPMAPPLDLLFRFHSTHTTTPPNPASTHGNTPPPSR